MQHCFVIYCKCVLNVHVHIKNYMHVGNRIDINIFSNVQKLNIVINADILVYLYV